MWMLFENITPCGNIHHNTAIKVWLSFNSTTLSTYPNVHFPNLNIGDYDNIIRNAQVDHNISKSVRIRTTSHQLPSQIPTYCFRVVSLSPPFYWKSHQTRPCLSQTDRCLVYRSRLILSVQCWTVPARVDSDSCDKTCPGLTQHPVLQKVFAKSN